MIREKLINNFFIQLINPANVWTIFKNLKINKNAFDFKDYNYHIGDENNIASIITCKIINHSNSVKCCFVNFNLKYIDEIRDGMIHLIDDFFKTIMIPKIDFIVDKKDLDIMNLLNSLFFQVSSENENEINYQIVYWAV